MPLAFLIDGYNLIHALGLVRKQIAPKELETARRRLLDFLRERLEPRAAAITVSFAGRGEEADDVIETLLAQHPAPRRLVVVSDDRRLRDAAVRRRARSMG